MFKTIAWGIVDGVTGIPDNFRGVVTVNRTGAGVYTLTLDDGIRLDNLEMMLTVTPTAGIQFTAQSSGGSDSVKTIRTYNAAGVAADIDFYFELKKLDIL